MKELATVLIRRNLLVANCKEDTLALTTDEQFLNDIRSLLKKHREQGTQVGELEIRGKIYRGGIHAAQMGVLVTKEYKKG